MLHSRFEAILPEGEKLELEVSENRLEWVIYRYHKWNVKIYHWMPVKFITMLTGQIKEIAMSFMNLLIRRNHLTRFRHCYEFDFFFECAVENLNYVDSDDSEKRKLCMLLESYAVGDISVFLDSIFDHKPIDVVKALKKYASVNRQEARLIECFRQGLPFISKKEGIMDYDYDPQAEFFPVEYEDTPPVTLDRMIRYVYDINDYVTNELEIMNNQYLQDTYAMEPVSSLMLAADSKLFVQDDYPEKFSQWFLEMVNITKEITDHE